MEWKQKKKKQKQNYTQTCSGMNNKPIATAYTDHVETNKKCNVKKAQPTSTYENEKQYTIDR